MSRGVAWHAVVGLNFLQQTCVLGRISRGASSELGYCQNWCTQEPAAANMRSTCIDQVVAASVKRCFLQLVFAARKSSGTTTSLEVIEIGLSSSSPARGLSRSSKKPGLSIALAWASRFRPQAVESFLSTAFSPWPPNSCSFAGQSTLTASAQQHLTSFLPAPAEKAEITADASAFDVSAGNEGV
eukprot:3934132-Rhodomonas_salina.10